MHKSKYLEFEEMEIRFSPSQLVNQVKREEFGEMVALGGSWQLWRPVTG